MVVWAREGEERHLALLSKIPFTKIDTPKDLSFKYFEGRRSPSRGLMEIEFKSGDTKWSLFNLHLKSKWTERPDDPEAAIRREKKKKPVRFVIIFALNFHLTKIHIIWFSEILMIIKTLLRCVGFYR